MEKGLMKLLVPLQYYVFQANVCLRWNGYFAHFMIISAEC